MKLAVLIQCHKNAEQINRLLNAMKNDNVEFYIHVDEKSSVDRQLQKRNDIHVLSQIRLSQSMGLYSSGDF